MRKCYKCLQEKPLDDFRADKNRLYGRGYICKPCSRGEATRQAQTLEEALYRHVERGDPLACWPWQAGTDKDGYGIFRFQGKLYRAHRAAFELHHRPLEHGEYALHTCHNPQCCNDNHLYAGTQRENMRDAKVAGRNSRGSHRPTAKLTEEEVLSIRALADSIPQQQLAIRFRVTDAVINGIVRGRTWQHVGDVQPPKHLYESQGAGHHLAKLTAEDVQTMRMLYPTHSLSTLAKRFHIDTSTASAAIHRKTWKHVP